jgi:hypothetical protein
LDATLEILQQNLAEALARANARTLDYVVNGQDYGYARYLRGVAVGLELAIDHIRETDKRLN